MAFRRLCRRDPTPAPSADFALGAFANGQRTTDSYGAPGGLQPPSQAERMAADTDVAVRSGWCRCDLRGWRFRLDNPCSLWILSLRRLVGSAGVLGPRPTRLGPGPTLGGGPRTPLSRLAQQCDDPNLVELAGRVVALSRPAIHGGRDQQAGGGVRTEHLGLQATPGGEVTDAQQFIHVHSPCLRAWTLPAGRGQAA